MAVTEVKKMRHARQFEIIAYLSVCGLPLLAETVHGGVPEGPPTFSNALEIDNRYLPFHPGTMRIYEVTEQEDIIGVTVDFFLEETRTFQWNGSEVPCRIMKSLDFQDGQLDGISWVFLAQADDGTVYFFGELDDTYVGDGVVVHHSSWLVGGPTLPTDPPFSEWRADPTIFMLAEPEVGDSYKREDIPPTLDETNEVVTLGVDVSVPGGDFDDAIEILETTSLEPGLEDTKWYAPGVGVVKGFDGIELTVLLASTPPGTILTDINFWSLIH